MTSINTSVTPEEKETLLALDNDMVLKILRKALFDGQETEISENGIYYNPHSVKTNRQWHCFNPLRSYADCLGFFLDFGIMVSCNDKWGAASAIVTVEDLTTELNSVVSVPYNPNDRAAKHAAGRTAGVLAFIQTYCIDAVRLIMEQNEQEKLD